MANSTQSSSAEKYTGCCACQKIRYSVTASPLFVHCCHCYWCQRETGSAFVINALIESDNIVVSGDPPEEIVTPSESGRNQTIVRCPDCKIALWSHYAGIGSKVAFLRVGTLDNPDQMPPDIHIYTESKQRWLQLSHDVPIVKHYYARKDYWPSESIERLRLLREA